MSKLIVGVGSAAIVGVVYAVGSIFGKKINSQVKKTTMDATSTVKNTTMSGMNRVKSGVKSVFRKKNNNTTEYGGDPVAA
jgi:hypothetical protein